MLRPILPVIYDMNEYEQICSFENLYRSHKLARRGKRKTREVIDFEMRLSENLTELSDSLKNCTYNLSGYYTFMVHDPKDRIIHALHYCDRVVQHCICDEVLAPTIDKRLIYDNAACRIGKGTHFAIGRLNGFMHSFYKTHGPSGWFLRCDIRKFFDNIDHQILKEKIGKVFHDVKVINLLHQIIDSYEKEPGKGLPLGNQTSQWFALYYLDGLDRLIKEKLHLKYYTRYMDDFVLIHQNKQYLMQCKRIIENYLKDGLGLLLNEKTAIFPIKNGVDYLGWHFYLTNTGKVIRKVKQSTKSKYRRKLKYFRFAYSKGIISFNEIKQSINSYHAHLSFGHTHKMQHKLLRDFVLTKASDEESEK